MGEFPCDMLAKDTGGYSYTLWGPSGADSERNANCHFRDVPLIFNFGHPSVHDLYNADVLGSPSMPSDRAMSELVMKAFSSFAKTHRPQIPDVEWLPYPENMNLQLK